MGFTQRLCCLRPVRSLLMTRNHGTLMSLNYVASTRWRGRIICDINRERCPLTRCLLQIFNNEKHLSLSETAYFNIYVKSPPKRINYWKKNMEKLFKKRKLLVLKWNDCNRNATMLGSFSAVFFLPKHCSLLLLLVLPLSSPFLTRISSRLLHSLREIPF